MTPAVLTLQALGVAHTVHEYERGSDLHDIGRDAADALGLDHDQVFKTLVLHSGWSAAPGTRRERRRDHFGGMRMPPSTRIDSAFM